MSALRWGQDLLARAGRSRNPPAAGVRQLPRRRGARLAVRARDGGQGATTVRPVLPRRRR
ncbi:hypothetical protein GKE82_07925 [Conexibacter sp. W3-3-2]|uniref:hypothetical protein n=1 Tax=Conexibacter sp. W3-3-2 TaxID=2675227 RepID=UPI0012B838AC|nr:hypothetical protein [Conexibacter sp. W3-3-2]MTD44228.1 hypothetical protein [Conexibacter sp. W3-3-2]